MKPTLEVCLELHRAIQPFMTRRMSPSDDARSRLRKAVLAALTALKGNPPPALIMSVPEALEALDQLLKRCETLGVPWQDVVAKVNRGFVPDSQPYARKPETV